MNILCVRCSTEEDEVSFPSLKDLKEHEAGGHKSRPEKKLPPSPPAAPSATEKEAPKGEVAEYQGPLLVVKPLVLTYKWDGSCPACNTEVKTIEVDLGEKWVVVAFCIACNKKLKQQEVLPLPKPEPVPEPVKESIYPIHKLRGRPKKVS